MNEPKRRFFSGDSLQQALVQAANYFNLEPDRIAYRSIEKRHGFLKVRRKVVIEVDPDAPRREGPPPSPSSPLAPAASPFAEHRGGPPVPPPMPAGEGAGDRPAPVVPRESGSADREGRGRRDDRGPSRDRGPRGGDRGRNRDRDRRPAPRHDAVPRPWSDERIEVSRRESLVALPERPKQASERFPEAAGASAEAAAKGIALLLRIAGLDLQARILQGEERLEIDLAGEDVDWCFADDGEFLMAVEHLLPRVIRSLSGETVPVRVDCDNFHEIREERLRSLAQRVAAEVRRLHRSRTLEPMNPADRRIVHVTLADDPGVATESDGDGYFKRVTIRPA